jgi:uncharacterized protein
MSTFRTAIGWVLALCALVSVHQSAYAFDVPPNDGLVTVALSEGTDVISREQRNVLEEELVAYAAQTSNQIAIVIVQSLQGEAIEEVALQIARKWGVGSVKNNGILILFSYDDREVRIEVGYGLEGAVPDIVVGGIINTDMIPHFREGNYYAGLAAAISSLQKHIGGEYTADRYADKNESGFTPYIFFIGFILFQWLFVILGRTKSWWLGGVLGGIGGVFLVALYGWWLSIPLLTIAGLFFDFIVSKNFHSKGKTKWWAGGGWGPRGGFGGGRGGGGFGGFGGGGFGGGGASGRW